VVALRVVSLPADCRIAKVATISSSVSFLPSMSAWIMPRAGRRSRAGAGQRYLPGVLLLQERAPAPAPGSVHVTEVLRVAAPATALPAATNSARIDSGTRSISEPTSTGSLVPRAATNSHGPRSISSSTISRDRVRMNPRPGHPPCRERRPHRTPDPGVLRVVHHQEAGDPPLQLHRDVVEGHPCPEQ